MLRERIRREIKIPSVVTYDKPFFCEDFVSNFDLLSALLSLNSRLYSFDSSFIMRFDTYYYHYYFYYYYYYYFYYHCHYYCHYYYH